MILPRYQYSIIWSLSIRDYNILAFVSPPIHHFRAKLDLKNHKYSFKKLSKKLSPFKIPTSSSKTRKQKCKSTLKNHKYLLKTLFWWEYLCFKIRLWFLIFFAIQISEILPSHGLNQISPLAYLGRQESTDRLVRIGPILILF